MKTRMCLPALPASVITTPSFGSAWRIACATTVGSIGRTERSSIFSRSAFQSARSFEHVRPRLLLLFNRFRKVPR